MGSGARCHRGAASGMWHVCLLQFALHRRHMYINTSANQTGLLYCAQRFTTLCALRQEHRQRVTGRTLTLTHTRLGRRSMQARDRTAQLCRPIWGCCS